MWYLTGVLKYEFDKNALFVVMAKLRKIGCVPKGYCYPELIKCSKMPESLKQKLQEQEVNKQKIARK